MILDPQKGELKASFSDPAVLECPYPLYERLLDESPVYRDPVTGIYIVSRFRDVRRILLDLKSFVSSGIVVRVRNGVHAERATRMRRVYEERGWLPGFSL